MTIGNDAFSEPLTPLSNGAAQVIVCHKPGKIIPPLISKLISLQLFVALCSTPALLVTVEEAVKLEVLGAIFSAITDEWPQAPFPHRAFLLLCLFRLFHDKNRDR